MSFFEYKPDSRTRGHRLRLRHRRVPRLDVCKNWFAYRVVNVWNSLPDFVVESGTCEKFGPAGI